MCKFYIGYAHETFRNALHSYHYSQDAKYKIFQAISKKAKIVRTSRVISLILFAIYKYLYVKLQRKIRIYCFNWRYVVAFLHTIKIRKRVFIYISIIIKY